jgi:hypothetical protein
MATTDGRANPAKTRKKRIVWKTEPWAEGLGGTACHGIDATNGDDMRIVEAKTRTGSGWGFVLRPSL